MKHTITVLMTLTIFSIVNAQSYKSAFRTDICACLEEESLKRTLTDNGFKACLQETLPKYATQIDAQIVEEDIDKKFYKGQLARKDLLVAMQTELIYSCDVYYEHIYFIRNSKKLIARENTKESDLEKYDQMVALRPNAMAYFMRAKVQFNLGNIKETEADINKSLELNANKNNAKSTRHELLLLAWVYEEQERYAEAIALYDKIYFGDLDTQVAQLRALGDKKNGGTMANIAKTGAIDTEKEIKSSTRRTESLGNTSSKQIENKTLESHRSKTDQPKVEEKTDSSSLRKLFKMGKG
ncbi:tetratricopeptide repeat protein [Winogradskyella schleiferi]|uniref:tetratricopeptide repeat protein n=1 Tax=Winogradskyella schleiferi TaxID=2686078 RepID=UPI0015C121E1|nr:tetratricopeptide repeat protein [Winogradskyella schleiferi]